MIDLRHVLAVLARCMLWTDVETPLAPALAHNDCEGRLVEGANLTGPPAGVASAGVDKAGRPLLLHPDNGAAGQWSFDNPRCGRRVLLTHQLQERKME